MSNAHRERVVLSVAIAAALQGNTVRQGKCRADKVQEEAKEETVW